MYVHLYNQKLCNPEKFQPVIRRMTRIRLTRVPHFGKDNSCEPLFKIIHVSNNYKQVRGRSSMWELVVMCYRY